jgi:peptide/nickel transport system substrate-binding protein
LPLTQTRWPFFAALVVGGLAIAIFWYVVLANPRGEALPASGGHYVEGVLRPPERINPLFTDANQADADAAALVFSGLVRLDGDGTPKPDLAERWEITNNGQSYVFHLRNGVAWHDGEPFGAEDVVFTFNAIADPGFKGDPALAQLMQGVIVTARDPLTVEFKLEETYAPFLAYLTVGILPRHLLFGLDPNQLFNAPFNARPVGTGPYAFDRRTNASLELASNPTFYFGPPLISQFEFRVFADANALSSALRAHTVDGVLVGPDANADLAKQATADGNFASHALDSIAYFMIYLDTRSPQFADKNVRRALLQGLNVQTVIDEVASGAGAPSDVGIARTSWAHSDVQLPPFDPGAAARDLELAGWSRGRDGVREQNGTRLAFTLSTPNDPRRTAIAQNVAAQWRAIGVDARVLPLDAATYVNDVLLPRKFQAALAAVDPGPDPDPYPFWHSRQIAPPGRNLANYSETRIDDVLQRARQTTDPTRRKELYGLFAGYLIAATPSIPLYAPVYTYVQSNRIHGFSGSLLFTPASRFASIDQWYIETRTQ